MPRAGLLLDRDGVINEDAGYLHRIEDCRFIDGVFEMVRAFADRGFAVAIVTNQSGIGRGLYGVEEFENLMAWMRDEFGRRGARIDAVYHCPDHPTEGIGEYRRENACMSDIAAGKAAGVGMLVRLDREVSGFNQVDGYWVAGSHAAIVELLEQHRGAGGS
jgi:D-glycero-D-manno-heptose 1,7-bisphosphate phosphatase